MSGYRLKRKEDLDEGIRRVAHAQITDALDVLTGTQVEPVEAVHEARKDMKKLRSVLRLVRPRIGMEIYRRENRRFRDAGRILSEARDAQVRAATVEQLSERFRDDPPPGGWLETTRLINGSSDPAGLDDVRSRAAEMIRSGESKINAWPLDGDASGLLEPGLRDTYRRGRRSYREALNDPTDESLHEWRKRAKDNWYHLRLVRNGWKPLLRMTADEAGRLSDLLGDDHDLAILKASLDRTPALTDKQREHLTRLIKARRQQLQDDAYHLGARLYAEKPGAFARRISSYWANSN